MDGKSKKEILGMSTLSHKFQITVPKEVRESQNWNEGDKIIFVRENDRVYVRINVE